MPISTAIHSPPHQDTHCSTHTLFLPTALPQPPKPLVHLPAQHASTPTLCIRPPATPLTQLLTHASPHYPSHPLIYPPVHRLLAWFPTCSHPLTHQASSPHASAPQPSRLPTNTPTHPPSNPPGPCSPTALTHPPHGAICPVRQSPHPLSTFLLRLPTQTLSPPPRLSPAHPSTHPPRPAVM